MTGGEQEEQRSKDDLIDLYEAQEFAYEQIQIHTAKYGLLPRLADAAA